MARAKILQDIDKELDLVERESSKLRKKQAELDEEEKEIDAKLRYVFFIDVHDTDYYSPENCVEESECSEPIHEIRFVIIDIFTVVIPYSNLPT